MADRKLTAPRYVVFVHDCPHGDDAVEVRARKTWWGGPSAGGMGRDVFCFCIPRDDGLETERVARALEALAAAFRG